MEAGVWGVCVIQGVSTGVYIYLVFQGGVRGSWCLGVCVIQGVSKGVYIYLVFQGGVSGSWCLGVCV